MPYVSANDIAIHYEATGRGEPLILVHGSWSDHRNWQGVAPSLAESLRVVAYDRRWSGKTQWAGQGSRRDQEDDLAALIEALDCAPVHIAATSFGAAIAIAVAVRRPELVRSLIAHEPPVMSVLADEPEFQLLLGTVEVTIDAVLAQIERGEHEAAARQFVEEIALGPGAWTLLPGPIRATMIDEAGGFMAEQEDPDWAAVDLDGLGRLECPLLLTQGDQSPALFGPIVAKLAEASDGAELHTYRGAGHAPHLSHPDDYVTVVSNFLTQFAPTAR